MSNKKVLGTVLILIGAIFKVLTITDAIMYCFGLVTLLNPVFRFHLLMLACVLLAAGLTLLD